MASQIRNTFDNIVKLFGADLMPSRIDETISPVIDASANGWLGAKSMGLTVPMDLTLNNTEYPIVTAEQSTANCFTFVYPSLNTFPGGGAIEFIIRQSGVDTFIGSYDCNVASYQYQNPSGLAGIQEFGLHGVWVPVGAVLLGKVRTLAVGIIANLNTSMVITPWGQGPPHVNK